MNYQEGMTMTVTFADQGVCDPRIKFAAGVAAFDAASLNCAAGIYAAINTPLTLPRQTAGGIPGEFLDMLEVEVRDEADGGATFVFGFKIEPLRWGASPGRASHGAFTAYDGSGRAGVELAGGEVATLLGLRVARLPLLMRNGKPVWLWATEIPEALIRASGEHAMTEVLAKLMREGNANGNWCVSNVMIPRLRISYWRRLGEVLAANPDAMLDMTWEASFDVAGIELGPAESGPKSDSEDFVCLGAEHPMICWLGVPGSDIPFQAVATLAESWPRIASGQRRSLATVETITALSPIEGADRIELARVRGWGVVVGKGEFAVGDRCVYLEIDSLLDTSRQPFAALAARGERTDASGRRGHVLKTARLRGVYSQGIAYPLSAFSVDGFPELPDLGSISVGADLTDALGIVVWEPPMSVSMAGELAPFPSRVQKTDEERVQNLAQILSVMDGDWVATEKVDGTSTTFALDGGQFAVAGHNWAILPNPDNALWQIAAKYGIEERLREWAKGCGLQAVAVQGETYGEKIQGNPLKVKGLHFAVFNVAVDGRRIPRRHWPPFALELSVPVIDGLAPPASVEDALAQADAQKSLINPQAPVEGIVWRSARDVSVKLPDETIAEASFKVVSNRYLLKHDR
ncbi:MAG: RNA ligase (ATP) [Propionibacteriaceae bacterium]|nr:RNA ligase (ATP) [Propionibacteriaceae bacterium]